MLLFLLLLLLLLLLLVWELLNMNLALKLFENASKSFCNWSQSTWSGVGALTKRLFKSVKANDEFPFKIIGSCSFEWEDVIGDCPSLLQATKDSISIIGWRWNISDWQSFVFSMFDWSLPNLRKRLLSKIVLNLIYLHCNKFLA